MNQNTSDIVLPSADEQVQQMTSDATAVVELAEAFEIDSPEMYTAAGNELKRIKTRIKDNEEARKALVKPLNDHVKFINDQFREPVNLLKKAEQIIKKSILAYDQEQERIRREQQRKAEEAARAEEERLRKEAEEKAAKARAEAEEKRKAAQKAEDQAAQQKAAEEAAQAELQAQEAEEQASMKPHVHVPVMANDSPKVKGISKRKVWKARVVDFSKLPDDYKVANEKALGALARSTQGSMNIPGVEFYADETIAAG